MTNFSIDFPKAYSFFSDWQLSATFRQQADDFFVEEHLGFPLSGEGEHCCLLIEKRGHNTHWVSAELARYSGIAEKNMGVCGRKDRHAVTRQWFSLYDPERKPIDWSGFTVEGINILSHTRHSKKLRPGMHESNHFVIRLREVSQLSGQPMVHSQELVGLLSELLASGVPNYFGPQRFGRQCSNLVLADDWFNKNTSPPRKQQGMVLSAARSYLFNQVLAARIRHGSWKTLLNGDVVSDDLPTGPLWGRGRLSTQYDVLMIEQKAVEPFSLWCERLEFQGLKQERRPFVLLPRNISVVWEGNDLVLSFSLPAGGFATSVLSEIAHLKIPE